MRWLLVALVVALAADDPCWYVERGCVPWPPASPICRCLV